MPWYENGDVCTQWVDALVCLPNNTLWMGMTWADFTAANIETFRRHHSLGFSYDWGEKLIRPILTIINGLTGFSPKCTKGLGL